MKPKGETTYEIAIDRSEQERTPEEQQDEQQTQVLIKKQHPGVDSEARWIKKAGKTRYGYNKHHVTDTEGMVIGRLTTPANVNEIANLEEDLATSELPEHLHIYADKGYRSAKNEELLKAKKLKSRILHKAKKGNPLTEREKLRNKLIGKTRFKVERTFAGITRWFNSTCARNRGILKMHTQNLIEAIAYNLYRSAGISCVKTNKHSRIGIGKDSIRVFSREFE